MAQFSLYVHKSGLLYKGCDHTPKKTRNLEKDLKKTEKDFIFNRILFICYYNPILYISMLGQRCRRCTNSKAFVK